MPAPLRCPTCSAPLDVPPEHVSAVRCTYCGAGVLLTERGGRVAAAAAQERHTDAIADVLRHLRAGNKIVAVAAYREHFGTGLKESKDAVDRLDAGQPGYVPGPANASPIRHPADARPAVHASAPKAAVIGALLVVLVACVLVLVNGRGEPETPSAATPSTAPTAAPASPSPAHAPREARFAREVLRFGSEGTGAGRFQDARSVAVDGTGRIYVAEYTGGRVQVFDSAGTFLTQWMADAKMPLVSMAADRGGTVYVVQRGLIHRYEGATGRALEPLPAPRQSRFEDVTVALDGTLWAVADRDVVHLSRDGEVLRTIHVRDAVDEDADPARVAVSGAGDVYVLDNWKADVYHLNRDGRFVDRFGGGGFPAAEDVAVDGAGRVFVSDIGGSSVQVYSATGQPLGTIDGIAVVFGMTVNDRDALFVAARNDHQVLKFRVPAAERG